MVWQRSVTAGAVRRELDAGEGVTMDDLAKLTSDGAWIVSLPDVAAIGNPLGARVDRTARRFEEWLGRVGFRAAEDEHRGGAAGDDLGHRFPIACPLRLDRVGAQLGGGAASVGEQLGVLTLGDAGAPEDGLDDEREADVVRIFGRGGNGPDVISEHGSIANTHHEEHDEGVGAELGGVLGGAEDTVLLALVQGSETGVVDDPVGAEDGRGCAAEAEQVTRLGEEARSDEDCVRLTGDDALDRRDRVLGPSGDADSDTVVDGGDEAPATGAVEESAKFETGSAHG